MASRVAGAVLALAAAALLAVSIVVTAWWTGHPSFGGAIIHAKEIFVGPLGATGCNTGGDGACMTVPVDATFSTIGFALAGASGLLVVMTLLVCILALADSPKRRTFAVFVVVGAVIAALLAVGLVLVGPHIRTDAPLPITLGLYLFFGGITSAFASSVFALRASPPPRMQLAPARQSLAPNLPPPPHVSANLDVHALLAEDALRPSSLGPEPKLGRGSPAVASPGGALPGPSGPLGASGPHAAPLFSSAPQLRPLYEASPGQGGTGGFVPMPPQNMPLSAPMIPRDQISALAGIPTPASAMDAARPVTAAGVMPAPGMPTGMPPTGMPPGMSPTGMPPGMSPTGMPGMPPAPTGMPGMPPSPTGTPTGMPPGMSPTGMPTGMPPAGMSPTGMPPVGTGMPPAGMGAGMPHGPRTAHGFPPPEPVEVSESGPNPETDRDLLGVGRLGANPRSVPLPDRKSIAPIPPLVQPSRTAAIAVPPPPAPPPASPLSAATSSPRFELPASFPRLDSEDGEFDAMKTYQQEPKTKPKAQPKSPPKAQAKVPAPAKAPAPARDSKPPLGAAHDSQPPRGAKPTVPATPPALAATPSARDDQPRLATPRPPTRRLVTDDAPVDTDVSTPAIDNRPSIGESFDTSTSESTSFAQTPRPPSVSSTMETQSAPPDTQRPPTSDDEMLTLNREKVASTDMDLPTVRPPTDTSPSPVVPTADVESAPIPVIVEAPDHEAPTDHDRGNAPPATKLPLSTADASLPPPSEKQAATSGPSPACPQCEAPMAWVEAHLRFYCKSCKMYF